MPTFLQKTVLFVALPVTGILLYFLLRSEEDEEEEMQVVTTRQVAIKVNVPKEASGAIIGQQGSRIKKIQDSTHTRVNFEDDVKGAEESLERTLIIRGTPQNAQLAELEIRRIVAELPSIEQIDIFVPVKATGRIIGKGGETIRSLSRICKAKISVDREEKRRNDGLKKVTIRGTPDAISLAKGMIEEKVQEEEACQAKKLVTVANRQQRGNKKQGSPARDMLQDLGDYTTANGHQGDTPSAANKLAAAGVQLKQDDYLQVYVSAVENPGHFWLQFLTDKANTLDQLVADMTSYYGTDNNGQVVEFERLQPDDLVAAPFTEDERWYRAQVVEKQGDSVDLYYVDYGDNGLVHKSKVKKLRGDYLSLPFQALECSLANIKPIGENWSEESTDLFEKLTYTGQWQVLMAKTITYNSDTHSMPAVQLIDTNGAQDVDIAQELVTRNFALVKEDDKQSNQLTVECSPQKSSNQQMSPKKSPSLFASIKHGTEASLYQEGSEFHCLDGSLSIPFERINDNYCDCQDASDEPGTSACPNGSFHCTNAGYKPAYIPSSWVNDGVCDCCDGTDEVGTPDVECTNNCKELGRQLREDMEKLRQLKEEGHKIFLEYSQQSQEARKEKQQRKIDLEQVKAEMKSKRDVLEAVKNEKERPANDAKKRHEDAWNEEKEKRAAERERSQIVNAFNDLDADKDGQVTVEEMQLRTEFDIDTNGEVSLEEAKEYLEDQDAINQDLFTEKVWPNIKEIYKPLQETREPVDKGTQAPAEDQPVDDQENDDDDRDDEYGDEEEDLDDLEEEEYIRKSRFVRRGDVDDYDNYQDDGDDEQLADEKPEDKMPEYDEETKRLIEEADQAKKDFEAADHQFKEVEREIDELSTLLDLDLGDMGQFYPLKGNCYEFSDSQYTYKLCPFDRTSQRPKTGGSETNLGRWGKWDGPSDNKYSVMKYDRGQNCWNGPDRSCRILLECGLKNELLAASEPNRCEYEFRFATPALCSVPPSANNEPHQHIEL